MSTRRAGIVLVAALLVLLALTTVSTALLFVSTQESLIARSDEAVLRARSAAESGARAVVAGWSTADYRGMAVGEARQSVAGSGLGAGANVTTTVVRLAGRLFLVRAEARFGTGATASAAMVVRTLGIDEVWADFPAAVTSAGSVFIGTDAVVLGYDAAAAPPMPEYCPAVVVDTMALIFGAADRPAVLDAFPMADTAGAGGIASADSSAAASGASSASTLRLGPLEAAAVSALADRVAIGTVEPQPRSDAGDCVADAADNWGDPREPAGPCAGFHPLIYAPGDLRVTAGIGQGVLVVDGDLELAGSARFHGAVRVAGALSVRDSAAILGAAVAGSAGARVEGAGNVHYDPCALWAALRTSRGLNRALAPAERLWVPVP